MKILRYILPVVILIAAAVFYSSYYNPRKPQAEEVAKRISQPANNPSYPGSQQLDGIDPKTRSAERENVTPASTASGNKTQATQEELDKLTETEQKSLWAAFSEARREIRPIPQAWSEREENMGFDFYSLHPKQNLTTRFGDEGVQMVSSNRTYTEEDAQNPTTSWTARMSVLSLAGNDIPLGASAEKAEGSGSRVEYRHNAELTEWYDNGVTAMEHGYTIARRPAHLGNGEEVVIEVALDGLHAVEAATEDGTARLNFNAEDRTVLSYSKLLVIDAGGNELPATMKPTHTGFALAYNDSQAIYPVTIDPLIINEEAKLNLAEGFEANNKFGRSVAISGDTVVIGAEGEDDGGTDSGSAYVFARSNGVWSLQAKLNGSDTAAFYSFGISVSISGDSVVVGTSFIGKVYVFIRNGSSWSEQAKLIASDAAIGDRFGYSVSISGDSIVVGADEDDDTASNSGSAYIFTRGGSSWSQQAKLNASDAASGFNFGSSVAISGDSVVVGSPQSEGAYVFTRSGISWSQQAKLVASDATGGNFFGISVSISVNSVVVGAPLAEVGSRGW